jgi:hypothetical protein
VGRRCDTARTAKRERGGVNTCDTSLGESGNGSVSRTKFCSRASLPLCRSRLRASTSGLYVMGRGPCHDDGYGLEGTFLLAMRFMRRGSDSMWKVCLCSKLTTGAAAAELPIHQAAESDDRCRSELEESRYRSGFGPQGSRYNSHPAVTQIATAVHTSSNARGRTCTGKPTPPASQCRSPGW